MQIARPRKTGLGEQEHRIERFLPANPIPNRKIQGNGKQKGEIERNTQIPREGLWMMNAPRFGHGRGPWNEKSFDFYSSRQCHLRLVPSEPP